MLAWSAQHLFSQRYLIILVKSDSYEKLSCRWNESFDISQLDHLLSFSEADVGFCFSKNHAFLWNQTKTLKSSGCCLGPNTRQSFSEFPIEFAADLLKTVQSA